MMKKYLFCDLDNTLLYPLENNGYGIREHDLQALHKAFEGEFELVINSGRPASVKKAIAKQLGREVDALGFNGSQLSAKEHEQILASISLEDYIRISEEAMHDFPQVNCATIDFEGTYYINDPSRKQPYDRFYAHYKAGIVQSICTEPAIEALKKKAIHKVAKILFFIEDLDQPERLMKQLNERYGDRYDFIRSSALFLEGQCKGISKASIMDTYRALYGIEETQCYVIGDADNDLEMLNRFKQHSFCMAHGSEKAKQTAMWCVKDLGEALRIMNDD